MANELLPFEDMNTSGAHLLYAAGKPALRGGQCGACSKRFFPLKKVCPYCGAASPTPAALPTQGVLYAYATVHVSSSRPTPYKIGYVDLDREVRVLATLLNNDALQLDAPVRLVVSFEGEWAFAPLSQAERT